MLELLFLVRRSDGWSHVWFVIGLVSSGLKHSEFSLVTLVLVSVKNSVSAA